MSAPYKASEPAFRLPRSLDRVALLQALCAIIWLPQAGLLAWAIASVQQGSGFQSVIVPAALVVALGALRAFLESWASARLHEGARRCLTQWRAHAVSVLAAQSPLDRRRVAAGAAASILSEQAEAIMPWLTRYRMASWRARVIPLLILLPVLWFSWSAALVLVVAAPLIPIFMAIVGWRAKAASEAQWLQMGDMNTFLLDRLRGLPTLRAMGAVPLTAKRLRASAEDLRERTMRVLRIAFLSSAVLELFSALGVALVAVFIGFHLLGHIEFGAWGDKLTLAEGVFVLLLAPSFFEPLRELAAVWHDKASGQAAVDALKRLSCAGLQIPGGAAAHGTVASSEPLPSSPPGVQVRSLSFSFPDEPPIFADLDLVIEPGEKVALAGASGSGKTVLLSLLAGLLPAQSGQISIAGTELDAEHAALLQSRIGWMGQRPHVFAGSVATNIALAQVTPDAVKVAEALEEAGLGGVAQAHPGTLIGEGGHGLSGGEAARLALARLLATTGKDLWLVDEPTAHLDRATSDQIIDTLLGHACGRTLIIATHDPALIQRLDRVIQLPSLSLVYKGRP